MAYKESLISNIKSVIFSRLDPWLNFSRDRSKKMGTINTIVLHWTASNSVKQAIDYLVKLNTNGYHFIIGKDGKIIQTVPLSRKAWHAGASYGPNGYDVNTTSIGISMDLLNGNEVIPEEMYQSVLNLIKDLKIAVPSLKWITGHQWISPGRKVDPYTFDFRRLIKEPDLKASGFKLWRTGDLPFPKGLDDCKCVKYVNDDTTKKCLKSSGNCSKTSKVNQKYVVYEYGKSKLNNDVLAASDLTIDSDLITDES
tara:strand:+ start:16338 stop:17099 length:762 start_codon:yes stop_codon:yes gene_type:complete